MPFDLNSGEFLILLVLAFIILGPKRIQEYTRKGANMLRELRRMANGAKSQLEEEMGPEFKDIDWKKLDPRQYDPRRIVREVLSEDFTDAAEEFKAFGQDVRSATQLDQETVTTFSASSAAPKKYVPLAEGQSAPFDPDAT